MKKGQNPIELNQQPNLQRPDQRLANPNPGQMKPKPGQINVNPAQIKGNPSQIKVNPGSPFEPTRNQHPNPHWEDQKLANPGQIKAKPVLKPVNPNNPDYRTLEQTQNQQSNPNWETQKLTNPSNPGSDQDYRTQTQNQQSNPNWETQKLTNPSKPGSDQDYRPPSVEQSRSALTQEDYTLETMRPVVPSGYPDLERPVLKRSNQVTDNRGSQVLVKHPTRPTPKQENQVSKTLELFRAAVLNLGVREI
jgi:hypothetical protein